MGCTVLTEVSQENTRSDFMKNNNVSIEESIQFAIARKLSPIVINDLQKAAAKYAKRPSNATLPNSGDLTDAEMAAIQQCADKYHIDIVVVGSALYGKRLRHGASASIGHGSNSKSDIDYIIPNKQNAPLFQIGPFDNINDKPQAMLPERDQLQGIMFATPHIYLHRLWFKPNARARLLSPGMPNPGLAPSSPYL